MDIPDIKSRMSVILGMKRNILSILEKMAFQDRPKNNSYVFYAPEPYMHLGTAMRLGLQYYNFLSFELQPDPGDDAAIKDKRSRLDLIKRWIDMCQRMSQSGQGAEALQSQVDQMGAAQMAAGAMPAGTQAPQLPTSTGLPQGIMPPQ